MENHVRRLERLGPLHDLLLKACPPNAQGIKSIPILADAMELTPYTIYKWIANGKVPPGQAVRITEISQGQVVRNDFDPYVYKS